MRWILAAVAAIGMAGGAIAQPASTSVDVSPYTQDNTQGAARQMQERTAAYVLDATALNKLRNCAAGRTPEARAAINRLLAARRSQFLESVPDPYWRGHADGIIGERAYRLAMEIVEEVNGRRPSVASDRACAEANERAVRMLLR